MTNAIAILLRTAKSCPIGPLRVPLAGQRIGRLASGHYAILDSDADVVWEDPCPVLDPLFDMTDEEIDALPNGTVGTFMKAVDGARAWGKRLRYVDGLRSARLLMAACIANGWDAEQHGSPETWLAQQVAKCLQTSEVVK